MDKRSLAFQARFSLPNDEPLLATFHCALHQTILHQGMLYLSPHFVCFYASILGRETKLVLPAAEITGISLAKSLGVLPNAIKIYTSYSQYWLGSFVNRQKAYELMSQIQRGEVNASEIERVDAEDNADAGEETEDRSGREDEPEEATSAAAAATTRRKATRSRGATDDGEDDSGASDAQHAPRTKPRSTRRNAASRQQEAEAEAEREQAAAQQEREEADKMTTVTPQKKKKNAAAAAAAAKAAAEEEEQREAERRAEEEAEEEEAQRATRKGKNGKNTKSGKSPPAAPKTANRRRGQAQAGSDGEDEEPEPAKPRQRATADDDENDEDENAGRGRGKNKAIKDKGRGRGSPDDEDEAEEQRGGKGRKDENQEENDDAEAKPVDSDDINEDDEILQKLRSASRRAAKAPHHPVFSYPPLAAHLTVDPAVEKAHASIRQQPKSFSLNPAANPSRRLIHEGYLDRQTRWSFLVVQRRCFLFSDCLCITSVRDPTARIFQFKAVLPLEGLEIDARPRDFQGKSLRGTKMPHPFRLIYTPPSTSPPSTFSASTASATGSLPPLAKAVEYIVSCDDVKDYETWLSTLELAIAAFYYNQNPFAPRPFAWYYRFVRGTPHQAVFEQDLPVLQALLSPTVSSSASSQAATEAETKKIVQHVDLEGHTLLHICAHQSSLSLIPLLCSKGAIVLTQDAANLTPLHVAAERADLAVLNSLLEEAEKAGEDVQFSSLHGGNRGPRQTLKATSALWLCALRHEHAATASPLAAIMSSASSAPSAATASDTHSWIDCFSLILSLAQVQERKAALNDRDSDGFTLLETCAISGFWEVTDFLMKLGASIDLPVKSGLTSLGAAVKKGDLPVVKALIAAGAQPNLRFVPTLTPVLAYTRNVDLAVFLSSVGARLTQKNAKGVRPLDAYASDPMAVSRLQRGETLHAERVPLDSDSPMHPQAANATQNGGHSLDSCALCQDEFNIIQRKQDFCRRCGLNVCTPCSSKKLIFRRVRDGKKERVMARVCDGCYNLTAFRADPDTGFVGVKASKSLKIKKKGTSSPNNPDAAPERSVKKSRGVSVSRRWEDVSEEDDEEGAGGAADRHAAAGEVDDDSYESAVEEGGDLGSNIRSGFKKGMKGAWKVGNLLSGKLTNVLDTVSDKLTQASIPTNAVRKGGVVNARGEEVTDENGDQGDHANEQDEEDEDEEDAPTPQRSRAASAARNKPAASANGSAADARSSAQRAKQLAAANLAQMDEMQDKAGNLQAEAKGFGALASQLKSRAKRGQL